MQSYGDLQLPIFFLPPFIIRKVELDRMLLKTQGTIDATMIALLKKWVINLSGG